MRKNTFVLFVFGTTLIASVLFVYPFYSIVLVDLYKGTTVDWAVNIYLAIASLTSFGSCIYSLYILRTKQKIDTKIRIILSILLVVTLLSIMLQLAFIYVASKY